MAKASDNLFPKVLITEGSAPASPAAGGQALFIDSADHKLKRKNSSGTVTTIEGGGGGTGQGLVDFAKAQRASTDITVNSTTFVNVDTALDLVMTASTGDVIEYYLALKATCATSSYAVFDVHTIVGGSPVNSLSSGAAAGTTVAPGHPAWARSVISPSPGGTYLSGHRRYALQAGDISSGTVTLRLRVFCGASTVLLASDPCLYVEATNLGQQL